MFLIHLPPQTGINISILTDILIVNDLRYFSYRCSGVYSYQLLDNLV